MTVFKKKEIANKTLGERLKRIREEAGISLEEMEEKIAISKKYINSLEEGRYEDLPGEVYTKSFLKKYSQAVRVNEEKVMKMYEKEENVFRGLNKDKKNQYRPPRGKVSFSPFNPKFFKNGIIVLLILGILVYLGWELTNVISPPKLEVSYPPDKMVTTEKVLTISGQTEKEIKVLVNGKEVYVDTDGRFTEELVLKDGVNIIEISAHKKQGRESKITREILLKNDNL